MWRGILWDRLGPAAKPLQIVLFGAWLLVGQSWYLGKVDSASNVPVAGCCRWNSCMVSLVSCEIEFLYPTLSWTNHASVADLDWNKYHQPKTPLLTASPKKSNQKTSPKNLAAKTSPESTRTPTCLDGDGPAGCLETFLSTWPGRDQSTFHMGNVQQYWLVHRDLPKKTV